VKKFSILFDARCNHEVYTNSSFGNSTQQCATYTLLTKTISLPKLAYLSDDCRSQQSTSCVEPQFLSQQRAFKDNCHRAKWGCKYGRLLLHDAVTK